MLKHILSRVNVCFHKSQWILRKKKKKHIQEASKYIKTALSVMQKDWTHPFKT